MKKRRIHMCPVCKRVDTIEEVGKVLMFPPGADTIRISGPGGTKPIAVSFKRCKECKVIICEDS